MTIYLEMTNFDDPRGGAYEVGVDHENGVTVNSECCSESMSDAVALRLYHALGDYLASIAAHAGDRRGRGQ